MRELHPNPGVIHGKDTRIIGIWYDLKYLNKLELTKSKAQGKVVMTEL